MIRVFRFEFQRLMHFRFFWIFSIGYFLCLLMMSWMGSKMFLGTFENMGMAGGFSLTYPQLLQALLTISDYFEPFLALILIMMISNEYELNTLRQHVVDGLSFEEVIAGRKLQMLIVFVMSCLMVFTISVFLKSQWQIDHWGWPDTKVFLGFALSSLGQLSVAVLFVSLLKKSVPVIFLLFAYKYIIEMGLGYFLDFYLGHQVSQYLPMQVFSDLMPPLSTLVSENASLPLSLDTTYAPPFGLAVLYFALIWGAIYGWVKYQRFESK